MSINRLFYVLLVIAVLVITACTPQTVATPESTSAPVATEVSAPTSTMPAVEASPIPEALPQELKGHKSDVWSVAFSPDGEYLASGSSDGTARLWNLASGEEIAVFSVETGEVGGVVFSPDGKYL